MRPAWKPCAEHPGRFQSTADVAAMIDRIETFIADLESANFEDLARQAFALQYEGIAPYRRLCDRRGTTPETLTDWRDIPLIPSRAFKSMALHVAEPQQVFRSSGTTEGSQRSTHYHPFPDLYRKTIEASFPRFCLSASPRPAMLSQRPAMLSLIPSLEQVPDSSLSFMIDHVLARFAGEGSKIAIGRRGVDAPALRSWLAARQRSGEPALVLATALSLHQALQALDRLGLRFRLPLGSVIFETGGFKTRKHDLERSDLLKKVETTLAVPQSAVVREFGMTELTSQAYTRALLGGDNDLFVCPHWMRVRILDPETLEEMPAGADGMIALLDLANLGSALHLLTEDIGSADGDGFRLRGRAVGAELRGCSLTAEELAEEN